MASNLKMDLLYYGNLKRSLTQNLKSIITLSLMVLETYFHKRLVMVCSLKICKIIFFPPTFTPFCKIALHLSLFFAHVYKYKFDMLLNP